MSRKRTSIPLTFEAPPLTFERVVEALDLAGPVHVGRRVDGIGDDCDFGQVGLEAVDEPA